MILADKIILHRKKMNLTQEELASELNVSRQSVSKWEGAQSIPEMDKILLLSDLFNVSIDYLLRDELEDESIIKENEYTETRKLTVEEANDFLTRNARASKNISLGVMLCIISPILLIFLQSQEAIDYLHVSENVSVVIGISFIIIMVAIAVGLFLTTSFDMEKYEFLEKEPIDLQYGVSGIASDLKSKGSKRYVNYMVSSIMLLILSALPIIISGVLLDEMFILSLALPSTLLLVAIGVGMIVNVQTIKSGYDKLLQVEDYTPRNKKKSKLEETVGGVYWLAVTGIYLLLSFTGNSWGTSWIIFPVAGVLYGIISVLLTLFVDE